MAPDNALPIFLKQLKESEDAYMEKYNNTLTNDQYHFNKGYVRAIRDQRTRLQELLKTSTTEE